MKNICLIFRDKGVKCGTNSTVVGNNTSISTRCKQKYAPYVLIGVSNYGEPETVFVRLPADCCCHI